MSKSNPPAPPKETKPEVGNAGAADAPVLPVWGRPLSDSDLARITGGGTPHAPSMLDRMGEHMRQVERASAALRPPSVLDGGAGRAAKDDGKER
ncbi:MAG: hypothetical protein PHS60_17605 [Zavarzinia sp.]|nr:hypothetical protein [Zavarzinia sp.]